MQTLSSAWLASGTKPQYSEPLQPAQPHPEPPSLPAQQETDIEAYAELGYN